MIFFMANKNSGYNLDIRIYFSQYLSLKKHTYIVHSRLHRTFEADPNLQREFVFMKNKNLSNYLINTNVKQVHLQKKEEDRTITIPSNSN